MRKNIFDYPILYFSARPIEDFPEGTMKIITAIDVAGLPIGGRTGIEGLRLDFCSGVRLSVPKGNWHIRISEYLNDMVFFDRDVSEQVIISLEKYFIPWKVEVFLDGSLVFSHELDLNGARVNFNACSGALGETIALLPYVAEFQREYKAEVSLTCTLDLAEIINVLYPNIAFYKEQPADCYCGYNAATFQRYACVTPDDSRSLPMADLGKLCFGLNYPVRQNEYTPQGPRPITDPYVCIAVQASGAMKAWHYPKGWAIVTTYLKKLGYRVLCIDAEREINYDGIVVKMPAEAEDFTGRRPLLERAEILYYADFFIGLGSGLSWLADAVGCPTVIVSGFSLPFSEPSTPYRVINTTVCHGCYNDMRVDWRNDICPYHKGTEREFECSRKISPLMVLEAVERLRRDKRVGYKNRKT